MKILVEEYKKVVISLPDKGLPRPIDGGILLIVSSTPPLHNPRIFLTRQEGYYFSSNTELGSDWSESIPVQPRTGQTQGSRWELDQMPILQPFFFRRRFSPSASRPDCAHQTSSTKAESPKPSVSWVRSFEPMENPSNTKLLSHDYIAGQLTHHI